QSLGKGAGTGLRMLDFLYERPITTIRQTAQFLGKSQTATSILVSRFEELGILRETTHQGRYRRYAYDEFLALFTTDQPGRSRGA
ncbi:MAG TPA: hypothetical protein VF725_13190, partial [Ktedonobacterales bacterium]